MQQLVGKLRHLDDIAVTVRRLLQCYTSAPHLDSQATEHQQPRTAKHPHEQACLGYFGMHSIMHYNLSLVHPHRSCPKPVGCQQPPARPCSHGLLNKQFPGCSSPPPCTLCTPQLHSAWSLQHCPCPTYGWLPVEVPPAPTCHCLQQQVQCLNGAHTLI